MHADLAIRHSTLKRRGALFGMGSFLAVSALAGYFISQRTQMPMGEEIRLPGWRISFRVPAGWGDGVRVEDLRGAEVFVFSPNDDSESGHVSPVRFRRMQITNMQTAEDVGRDVLAQYSALLDISILGRVQFGTANFGDWPASFAKVDRPVDVLRDRLGLYVRVLAAVDRQGAETTAYAIDLVGGGRMTGREQAVWNRVVASIRTETDAP
ncbi:MAG: hypothetical protein GXP29_08525 [Planctomycetes bacterium]|nr:hypothetical protein [Planctomycetota bacterium]